MAALTGNSVQSTYGDLLQVGNSGSGIDGTLRTIEDGFGNSAPYQISSTTFNISGTGQLGGVAFGALATLNTVDTAQIDADAITTTEIVNLAVTEAKLSSAVQTKLNNTQNNKFDATVDPDGDNDSAGTDASAIGTNGTAIYDIGSTWINTATDQAYRCADATPTAAVWTLTTLTTAELGTMAVQNANAVNITGGSVTDITDITIADGGTGASTAANARTNLGLGSIATQDANSVSITGGSVTGIADLAVADGGTGASNAGDARTNLGIGSLGTQDSSNVTITGGSITGINDLAIADGGTGASNAGDARTNLGLGSIATQDSNSVSITGGTISGITIKDAIGAFIENAANQQYRLLIEAPYAGTIASTTTRSRSGTCTATFAIDGVSLGGAANSVSTTEQKQAHASANTFSAGDDIELTISANSSCEGVSITIELDRDIT